MEDIFDEQLNPYLKEIGFEFERVDIRFNYVTLRFPRAETEALVLKALYYLTKRKSGSFEHTGTLNTTCYISAHSKNRLFRLYWEHLGFGVLSDGFNAVFELEIKKDLLNDRKRFPYLKNFVRSKDEMGFLNAFFNVFKTEVLSLKDLGQSKSYRWFFDLFPKEKTFNANVDLASPAVPRFFHFLFIKIT